MVVAGRERGRDFHGVAIHTPDTNPRQPRLLDHRNVTTDSALAMVGNEGAKPCDHFTLGQVIAQPPVPSWITDTVSVTAFDVADGVAKENVVSPARVNSCTAPFATSIDVLPDTLAA